MTGDIEEKNKIEDNELEKKIEECQKLKDEYLAGWQRARADLLNYKKGELERIGELIKYADVGIILKILPILDNFEIAARQTLALSEERAGLSGQALPNFAEQNLGGQALPNFAEQNLGGQALPNFAEQNLGGQEKERINQVIQGFLLIKNQIQDFLKNQGVEEIKSVGEKFDPNFHEIIEEVEVKDKESGIIIEEIQKGYKINGRLLRPARVKISF